MKILRNLILLVILLQTISLNSCKKNTDFEYTGYVEINVFYGPRSIGIYPLDYNLDHFYEDDAIEIRENVSGKIKIELIPGNYIFGEIWGTKHNSFQVKPGEITSLDFKL